MNTIKLSGRDLSAHLSVYLYIDTSYPKPDMWIAYCPELDLCGYGYGEDAAKKSLEISLQEYFDYTLAHGTLNADLIAHGWHQRKDGRLSSPSQKTLMRNSQLSHILSLPRFRKEPMPAFV